MVLLLTFVAGIAVGLWAAAAVLLTHETATDRMNRRIGWAYGYGAGHVDASHGRYHPGSIPEDGRARPPVYDQESEPQ